MECDVMQSLRTRPGRVGNLWRHMFLLPGFFPEVVGGVVGIFLPCLRPREGGLAVSQELQQRGLLIGRMQ